MYIAFDITYRKNVKLQKYAVVHLLESFQVSILNM